MRFYPFLVGKWWLELINYAESKSDMCVSGWYATLPLNLMIHVEPCISFPNSTVTNYGCVTMSFNRFPFLYFVGHWLKGCTNSLPLYIPKSMEAFYQESGRAGRDQLLSRSVLYYGIDDRKRMVGLKVLIFIMLGCSLVCMTSWKLSWIMIQEFILNKSESKKLQPSATLQGGLSKKAMSDFIQVSFVDMPLIWNVKSLKVSFLLDWMRCNTDGRVLRGIWMP